MPLLLALVLLARVVAAAEPGTLAGTAAVIDGDTFRIGGTVVRLADIDAPELTQACDGGPASLRSCGVYVADALAERLRGRAVRCAVLGLDQYDRRIANCEVAGEDLSRWLAHTPVGATSFRLDRISGKIAPGEALHAFSDAYFLLHLQTKSDYSSQRVEEM